MLRLKMLPRYGLGMKLFGTIKAPCCAAEEFGFCNQNSVKTLPGDKPSDAIGATPKQKVL